MCDSIVQKLNLHSSSQLPWVYELTFLTWFDWFCFDSASKSAGSLVCAQHGNSGATLWQASIGQLRINFANIIPPKYNNFIWGDSSIREEAVTAMLGWPQKRSNTKVSLPDTHNENVWGEITTAHESTTWIRNCRYDSIFGANSLWSSCHWKLAALCALQDGNFGRQDLMIYYG